MPQEPRPTIRWRDSRANGFRRFFRDPAARGVSALKRRGPSDLIPLRRFLTDPRDYRGYGIEGECAYVRFRPALGLREPASSPRSVSSPAGSVPRASIPRGAKICYSCGTSGVRPHQAPPVEVAGRTGPLRPASRHWVCPKCGTKIPDGWPGPGFDRCIRCGIPLGERALTSAILDVSQRTGPLLNAGTGLTASGFALLLGLLVYGSSLFTALQGQTVPIWALGEILGAVGLFLAGGLLSGIAWRMNRRELRHRGIDSPLTRSAAQAFFPRYAISRLIRSGRLDPPRPVLPRWSNERLSPV